MEPPVPPSPPPSDDDALLAACDVETFRAGGPGGQHQNKTETAVRLRHRPSGIVVTVRQSRSQYRNRQIALAELRRRLEEAARPEVPRVATKPTRASKRRRLETKKKQASQKTSRRWRPGEE